MKTKMIKQQKLEGSRFTFFQIGLILSLSLALIAFEWRSSYKAPVFTSVPMIIDTLDIPLPLPPPPEPPPDELKTDYLTNIEPVPDDKELDDRIIPDAVDRIIEPLVAKIDFTPEPIDYDDYLFYIVENMPEFPGGDVARMEYLKNNLKYPREAMTQRVQGRVYVSFVVEADGSISNVSLLRGIGYGCDDEALRVIRDMPKWTPGIQAGKKVRVLYNTDIRFVLLR